MYQFFPNMVKTDSIKNNSYVKLFKMSQIIELHFLILPYLGTKGRKVYD